MYKIWIILVICFVLNVRTCDGSAWLQDPPSRSAAWYYQIQTPVNYNFRNLDCGGVPVKVNSNGSRNCGLCGDPYTDPTPRDNELGGKYANPRVRTRYYESGQVAEISIWNNLPGAPGFYEFRLCDDDFAQTQECLDKHLLTISDTGTTYMPVPKTQGLVIVHLQLPAGVTCNFCLLQWRFRKESLSGCDEQNWCGAGRGAQIEYYNCADVMIGAVGQPKPSFIEDPVYTAADYGSAYDVATIRTTPDGNNLVGSTTSQVTTTTAATTTTNGVPIITIPTGTTNNPTGTTTDPATTSGTTNPATTNGPITINTPGTTTDSNVTPPTDSRLVVDANGNAILGQSSVGGSNADNKYLLVLLSLLPLFGAVGLQSSRAAGPVQAFPVPPRAAVTWAVPVTPIRSENSFGFGNFGSANPAFVGTSGYGMTSSVGTYGSTPGFSSGYSVQTAGVIDQNNLDFNNAEFQFNSIQNPVVWNNKGGLRGHVVPRSVSFQHGTPYQPSPVQYSHPNPKPNLPPKHEYNSNPQPGYTPHNNFVPPSPGLQSRTGSEWPRNDVPTINSWQSRGTGQGVRNWQNNLNNARNNNWQNTGFLGIGNNVNFNGVGSGQRLPVPETVTQRTRLVTQKVTNQDNSFNLPGFESASRFQTNGARKVIETSQPVENTLVMRNGGGLSARVVPQTTIPRNNFITNLNGGNTGGRSFFVNDWYNMLFRRFPNPTRAL